MFEALKKGYRDAMSKYKEPPKKSQFISEGKLIPQEFIEAGDKLIQINPMWQWGTSVSEKLINKYLPKSKQYMYADIKSWKRLKDIVHDDIITLTEKDGFQVMDLKVAETKTLDDKNFMDDADTVKEPEEKVIQLDSDSDDDDYRKPEPVKKKKVNKDLRNYRVYITYDMYYHTPRFWLSGVDYKSEPLTKEKIYEEIMPEYIEKTVTEEDHPHLGTPMIFIHPCRHADVIKTLANQAMKGGKNIKVEQYLFIFLKFISSVCPGLELDYTTEIEF